MGLDFTKGTILFVDEIHRFNKAQQDAFLPYVERGTIRLIGATTENPSFEINAALLSRCRVYTLVALTEEQVVGLLRRALADVERGLGSSGVEADDEALATIRFVLERRCSERAECVGRGGEARGGSRGDADYEAAGCGGDAATRAAV